MKRFLGHVIAGLGLAASAFGIFTACSHDDSSIFIRGVLAPPLTASGGSCTYTPDPAAVELSSGRVDVAFATSYRATLLVANQLQARASVEQGRTETNRVNIQGIIARVTDVQGRSLQDPFTSTAESFIDPSQGGNASFGVIVEATILGFSVIEKLTPDLQARRGTATPSTRVIAYVKAFGVTLGGTRVESNEIQFPIDLCYGCLVTFPSGVSSPLFQPQPNCANVSSTSQSPSSPCLMGQDQSIDCRLCPEHKDICLPALADAGAGG